MSKSDDNKEKNCRLIAHGLGLLKEEIENGKENRYSVEEVQRLNDLRKYFYLPSSALPINFNLKMTQQDCFK